MHDIEWHVIIWLDFAAELLLSGLCQLCSKPTSPLIVVDHQLKNFSALDDCTKQNKAMHAAANLNFSRMHAHCVVLAVHFKLNPRV